MATKTSAARGARSAMRIIKKYPNRRLYDTATSGYITLTDVRQMVVENTPFEVRDAKTNEELTRTILLQIILEEEAVGVPMFSNDMLSQMIRFMAARCRVWSAVCLNRTCAPLPSFRKTSLKKAAP